MTEKHCPGCDTTKPIDDFGISRSRKDGHYSICKACKSARSAAAYKADPEKFKKRSKKWVEEHREKAREVWRKMNERKEVNAADRLRRQRGEALDRYNARHPDRQRARWRVLRAVRDGRLVRPESCRRCGRVGPVQFDHTHGYEPENALVGQWVCRRCHDDVGNERREAARRGNVR